MHLWSGECGINCGNGSHFILRKLWNIYDCGHFKHEDQNNEWDRIYLFFLKLKNGIAPIFSPPNPWQIDLICCHPFRSSEVNASHRAECFSPLHRHEINHEKSTPSSLLFQRLGWTLCLSWTWVGLMMWPDPSPNLGDGYDRWCCTLHETHNFYISLKVLNPYLDMN